MKANAWFEFKWSRKLFRDLSSRLFRNNFQFFTKSLFHRHAQSKRIFRSNDCSIAGAITLQPKYFVIFEHIKLLMTINGTIINKVYSWKTMETFFFFFLCFGAAVNTLKSKRNRLGDKTTLVWFTLNFYCLQ